ncbi:MAG: diguanylate cyclase domain-containing protein [Aminivibrio sp.]|jgi:diguanylate cyclase (GGDEF)-like protein
MDRERTITFLEERISFLYHERNAAVKAFETALDLNAFTASLTGLGSTREVLEETASKLRTMASFGPLAFYLVTEDDPSLSPAWADPPEELHRLDDELALLIEDRTVAWALKRKEPVIVSASGGREKLFLHAIASPSKIIGLLLAFVESREENGDPVPSYHDFLSIVLATAGGLLDNLLLRGRIDELNKNLHEKIDSLEKSREELSIYRDNLEIEVINRTRDLERANSELRREIEERKKAEEEVRYRAYHDALTGLANRELFSQRLQEAIDRKNPVAVLFMDLDGFKSVNDTLGHDTGDLLLQKIARRLTREVEEGDTVARMGGDEFTIVIPSPASLDALKDTASRILERVAKPVRLADREISVTASIGISICPGDGVTVQDLMKHADIAMYAAKEQGKNRYRFKRDLPGKTPA